mmetsp:Transcript_20997/g.33165  ORF Transcript_20997/g.33165 Transcript_20997/m.33165 type:complete len:98 (+) Transcript_20997:2-295(+)
MTFAPEWLAGSPALVARGPWRIGVYLFFMNFLWVWVPAILLWESIVRITEACDLAKIEHKDKIKMRDGGPSFYWIISMIAYLGLYVVLVPVILIVAK